MHTALLLFLLASAPAADDELAARAEPNPEVAAEPNRDPLPGDISGEGKPPPGAPGDQALWAEAHTISQRIPAVRTAATKLQWQARDDRYDERLGEAASRAAGAEAAALRELQAAYRKALAGNYVTLTRRWPVDPTRSCQYPMLQLTSAMRSGRADMLQGSRGAVKSCVEKALPAIEAMAASNAEVERLSAEAARLLGVAAPAPAAARAE